MPPLKISERITQLNSSRAGAAEGVIRASVKFRLVEERVEDIAIAVTTDTTCVPGKDRMVEDVEEVYTDLKFVTFPRRKRHPNRLGQADVKTVKGWRAQCVSADEAGTNRRIHNKASVV